MSEPRQNHDGAGIPPGMTKHNKESWVRPVVEPHPSSGQSLASPRWVPGDFQSTSPFLETHLQKDIPWEQVQEEDSRLTLPFLTVQAADKNTCVKFINGGVIAFFTINKAAPVAGPTQSPCMAGGQERAVCPQHRKYPGWAIVRLKGCSWVEPGAGKGARNRVTRDYQPGCQAPGGWAGMG